MRNLRIVAVSLLALLAVVGLAFAAETAKEVTLTGEIGCAMCAFNVSKDCATAIRVKDGDKQVVYYFVAAADKQYHAGVCKTVEHGSVTGSIETQGDKQVIRVSKVEFAKK